MVGRHGAARRGQRVQQHSPAAQVQCQHRQGGMWTSQQQPFSEGGAAPPHPPPEHVVGCSQAQLRDFLFASPILVSIDVDLQAGRRAGGRAGRQEQVMHVPKAAAMAATPLPRANCQTLA